MNIPFVNLDFFSVGVAVAATGILGFAIYFHNRKSATTQTFLFFSLITIFWGLFNFAEYQVLDAVTSLWMLRAEMFFAAWQAFCFYLLFRTFPRETYDLNKKRFAILISAVIVVSVLTLTPFFFTTVISFTSGSAPIVGKSFGLPLFALLAVGLVIRGIQHFITTIRKTTPGARQPFVVIIIGSLITFALIIALNFVLPSFFNIVKFIPFASVFTLPFLIALAVAITRYKVLNIKVFTTEIVSFFLIALTFFEVVTAQGTLEFVLRSLLFIFLLVFSILLVRSVVKEVEQREHLEIITDQLKVANTKLHELDRQKTDFLSIATHQLRTPLSIANGYLELLEDGGYGKVTKDMLQVFKNMDESNGRLISLVDQFLDITRIEQGRTSFDRKMQDVNPIITSAVEELQARAEKKGLHVEWTVPTTPNNATTDEEKFRHVVFNFIDNAIKYSDKGTVRVAIAPQDNGFAITVDDDGLGFDKVDESKFFQRFYRGENVKTTDVSGTGIGLYVCRMFIEDGHGGHVWAHSPGLGKGSQFGFWIPVEPPAQPAPVAKI